MRYCLEYLSGKATVGQNFDGTPGPSSFDRPILNKDSEIVLTKRHALASINKEDSLVLLLRDFKECIPRQIGKGKEVDISVLKSQTIGGVIDNGSRVDYLSNIELFLSHTGKKTIIRYEDIIDKSSLSVGAFWHLLAFLGLKSTVPGNNFIDNWNKLREDCMHNVYKKSMSDGKSKTFHRSKIVDIDKWYSHMFINRSEMITKLIMPYAH